MFAFLVYSKHFETPCIILWFSITATNGSGSKYRHSPTKDYEVVGHDRDRHGHNGYNTSDRGGYGDRYNKPDRDDNDHHRNGHHNEENGNGRMSSGQEIPPGKVLGG